MSVKTATLRPGLLVSLKTSVVGNVTYERRDIDRDYKTTDGVQKAKWETERTITDPEEHEAAIKTQTKCRQIISAICARSAFGLLCPEDAADRLDAAILEARVLADAFNETAKLSRVRVYIMCGRIAADDVEAVRAINSEVRELLREMESGVQSLDVKQIREAATKAKQLGAMLTPEAAARVQVAIDVARNSARRIVSAGDAAANEVDAYTMQRLKEARTAFIDLEDEIKEVRAPQQQGRAIDFDPSNDSPQRPRSKKFATEIEV